MKFKFFVFLLIFCLLVCTSCTKEQNYLSYQNYPMRVKGTLSIDTLCCDLSLLMKEPGVGEITIYTPARLSGYKFSVNGEGVWVHYDDLTAALDEEGLGIGVSMLVNMFSCNGETLSEISSRNIGNAEHLRLVYPKDDILVSVYLLPNETVPTQIEAQKGDSCAIFGIDSITY